MSKVWQKLIGLFATFKNKIQYIIDVLLSEIKSTQINLNSKVIMKKYLVLKLQCCRFSEVWEKKWHTWQNWLILKDSSFLTYSHENCSISVIRFHQGRAKVNLFVHTVLFTQNLILILISNEKINFSISDKPGP